MLLGAAKLTAGLLFGSSLARLLASFPASLLGVMLAVSGAELASTAARVANDKRAWCALRRCPCVRCRAKSSFGVLCGVFRNDDEVQYDRRVYWMCVGRCT
jgi:hypothetical protein